MRRSCRQANSMLDFGAGALRFNRTQEHVVLVGPLQRPLMCLKG